MDGVILAIDLGKFNSVGCWFDPVTRQREFRSIPSDPASVRAAIGRRAVSRVVIEACSAAGWVHDLCGAIGMACTVASTASEAWQWKRVKRKTDRDDALKLARLAAVGELSAVTVPAKPIRQWKSLIGLRKRLVGERGRGQNRIRGLFVGQGLPVPRGARAWSAAGLAGLDGRAKPLAACGPDELWRGELDLLLDRHRAVEAQIGQVEARLDLLAAGSHRVSLLTTIPGVGVRTAEVIATHLGDATRFRTADEVGAYAGLVPKQYQSGESDRRGRVTRRGSSVLRAALVECAWCCLRYNAWVRGEWRRLVAAGLAKKKAVVALARKLLIRCWAMLKRGEVWRDPLPSAVTAPTAA